MTKSEEPAFVVFHGVVTPLKKVVMIQTKNHL